MEKKVEALCQYCISLLEMIRTEKDWSFSNEEFLKISNETREKIKDSFQFAESEFKLNFLIDKHFDTYLEEG